MLLSRVIAVVLIAGSLSASGQSVPDQLLKEIAVNFMNENFPGGSQKIREIISYDSLNSIKIFQLDPGGWLMLSTDRKVEPVIGFSFTGHFEIPEQNLNNPMNSWFNLYREQIRQIVNDKSLKEQKAWNTGISKGTSSNIVRVNPFMTVNWGQGTGYNRFCPADAAGPGGHVYVGCVAVSMAQSMSVYKIPEKGAGYHNYLDPKYGTQYVNFANAVYHWDSMSVSLSDKYNALLLYHCAVAVDMKFGADGSGTQTLNAAAAMRNYFGFSHNILHKNRTGTVTEWHGMINSELLKGRPVVYAGDSDDGKPGHAFNIDGVMSSTYYHINWGWTGSNNGYFTLDALNPGVNNNFNKNQSAIIGIQPFYYPVDITLTDTVVREDLPAGTFVGKVKVTDEATDNTYTFKLVCDSVYNGSGWTKNFCLTGDSLKTGRVFTAADSRKDTVIISLADRFGNKLTRSIPLNIGSVVIGTGPEYRIAHKDYLVYPNPVGDILYLDDDLPAGLIQINIYSMNGSKIRQIVVMDQKQGIAVDFLKNGFYLLEAVFRDNTSRILKFVKE